MSNLSKYLFQIINDVPVYCPIQVNIPCFKELYLRDETSDKSEYAKQLAFIWYYCDANSPYFNAADKKEECLQAAFGMRTQPITPLLQACMDEYIKRQSTPELRSLDTIMNILNELLKSLNSVKQNSEEIQRYINDLDEQMKQENDLQARRVLSLMRAEAVKNMNSETTALVKQIPQISVVIKEMSELRKVVSQSLIEIDSNTNKENIFNHIIYNIIDENRGYVQG